MKGKKNQPVNQDPEQVLKEIGLKMAKIRKELGYTNSDSFAYDKGINRSQYGKYEAGSQDLQVSTLVRMVNKLGLTLEEFFSKPN